jgi:molecular chaperone DnaJ
VAIRQGFFQMVRTCPDCRGEGQVVRERCQDCRGTGRQPKEQAIEVKVPPGVHDGQVVRVPGEGEPGSRGALRGDLHAVVRIKPHHVFERHNDDLVLHMPISFTQAALGAKLRVPTLEGEEELTIQPGTQHGQTYTLPRCGLPNLRSGRIGDLVVQVLVEIPKKLSEEQERLLREFAETEDHDVLPHSGGFWDKIKEYLSGD